MTTVYAKLNAARAAFHAKQLKKSGKNNFAGYSYFELGDFLIPALQVFETYGLCPIVSFTEHTAHLDLVDVENGERILFTSPMAEANLKGTHPIQNLGAVETYQRRYLYMIALEIVEHDAIDASKPLENNEKVGIGELRISMDQLERVQDLIAETQSDVVAICKKLKVNSLKEMTQDQYEYVTGVLEKKKG
jgi:Xaa-Pro aminopeptidase